MTFGAKTTASLSKTKLRTFFRVLSIVLLVYACRGLHMTRNPVQNTTNLYSNKFTEKSSAAKTNESGIGVGNKVEIRAIRYVCFEEHGSCACNTANRQRCAMLAADRQPRVRVLVDRFTWLAAERQFGNFVCPRSVCSIEIANSSNTIEKSQPLSDQHDGWLSAYTNVHGAPGPTLQEHQSSFFVAMESCALYPQYCDGAWLRKQGFTRVLTMQQVKNIRQTNLSFLSWDLSTSLHAPVPTGDKRKAIAVFVSNCDKSNTGRYERLDFLMNTTLEIHSYGACLHTHDVESEFPHCSRLERKNPFDDFQKLCVFQHYRFALVIENFDSQGYMSEKLFHALAAGTVPIYYGHTDNFFFLPDKDAALFLSSDITDREIVGRIKKLMTDDHEYDNMLAWKTLSRDRLPGAFRELHRQSVGNLACVVCDAISGDFPTLLANVRPSVHVSSLSVSLSITFSGVHLIDDKKKLIFMTSITEVAEDPDFGSKQHSALSRPSLQNALRVEFQLRKGVVHPCDLVVKHVFFLIACPPVSVKSNTDIVLHLTTPYHPQVHSLTVPLIPEASMAKQRVDTAICSTTFSFDFNESTRTRLVEWVSYHSMLGFDLIVIYTRQVGLLRFLETFFGSLVELLDFPPLQEGITLPDKRYASNDKTYALNECLYRLKSRTAYVSFQEVDEFFVLEDDEETEISSFLVKNFRQESKSKQSAGLAFNSSIFISNPNKMSQGFDASRLQLEQFDTLVHEQHLVNTIVSTVFADEFLSHSGSRKTPTTDYRVAHYRRFINTYSQGFAPNTASRLSRMPFSQEILKSLHGQVKGILNDIAAYPASIRKTEVT